jgi:MraZ protein
VFVGVYERQLDERGRVALPPTFRTELGEHCYLAFGDDGCVSVRSDHSFEAEATELIEKVKRGEMSRDRQRAFASSATPATVDRQGRITLDAALRAQANIEPQAAVMVLGSLDQIEIWEPGAFQIHEEAGRAEIAGSDASDGSPDAAGSDASDALDDGSDA